MDAYRSPTGPSIRRRSPVSFDCCDVPGLSDWLEARGYRQIAPRTASEFGRLQRDGSILVLYHSGAIVAQGADTLTATQLLGTLVPADAEGIYARH